MVFLLAEIIGYLAAAVGTSLMLPQVVKSLKTKKVADLSLVMLILYLLNCVLWALYGFMVGAMPVIVCNLIALVIAVVQIAIKFVYSRKPL